MAQRFTSSRPANDCSAARTRGSPNCSSRGARGAHVDVRLGAEVSSVSAAGNGRTVRFADQEVTADELIVAIGREPRLGELSLENVGIEPGEKGIEVDERCRAAEGIWAIGDVTGVMPFTHVGKYQGRVACADILARPVRAEYGAVPRVVFSEPEVAAVGMTEKQATAAGIQPVTSHIRLAASIARPWTDETDPRGELRVIADPRDRCWWAHGPWVRWRLSGSTTRRLRLRRPCRSPS